MLNKQNRHWLLINLIILIFLISKVNECVSQSDCPKLDAPFEPSHPQVVDAMLELAKIRSSDLVYDLGCGDGRILIRAAKRYGVHGTGIDIDPQRIKEAYENSEFSGTTDKVKFIVGDMFDFDFSNATVVTLYVGGHINLKFRPILFQQLSPGTRIVSHAFDMVYWEPDSVVIHPKARNNKIFLWIIPAHIGGDWCWTTTIPDKKVQWKFRFTQDFQGAISKLVSPQNLTSMLGDVNLSGQKVMFKTEHQINGENVTIVYKGMITGDTINGTQEWLNSLWDGIYDWDAIRDPVNLAGIWEGKINESTSIDSKFKLCIHKTNNNTFHADYISNNLNLSDLSFYVWGANIRFEILGLTYKGFFSGNSIKGKITSDRGTKVINWSAYRKH